MPFGYLDTQYIDFPANVDVEYIRGLETAAGVDFQALLAQIDNRLSAFNSSLPGLVGMLVWPTTRASVDGTAPIAFEVNERGEYTIARAQQAPQLAHMLPIRGYDVAVGFTEDGLEEMSQQQILNNIESMLLGYRRLYRLQSLTRLFSDTEMRVDENTNQTSPGFAGSGTGANEFDRSFPDGRPLPGGYTHYFFADTDVSGELETTLKTAKERLGEWHEPPYDMVLTDAMMDEVEQLEGFVDAGSALIRKGDGESEALVDAERYEGVYDKEIRVMKPLKDASSKHASIFKRGGSALAEDNPLAWRYDENKGREAVLRYRDFYPLANAVLKQDFGIGVNDRTKAVNIFAASGASAYENPTFT